jgi:predicted PurR-regulated permease PerM
MNAFRSPGRTTLTVIGMVLLTALGLLLVYATHRVLTWMLVAAFLAVALNPAATWLERRAPWCPRWLATLLVFVVLVGVIIGVVAVLVVPLAREGARFAAELPDTLADVKAGRGPFGGLAQRLHLREYADLEHVRGLTGNLGVQAVAIVRGAFTTVAGILAIITLAYLMVLQAPKIVDGFLALFDAPRAERVRRVGADCARTVTGYLTGNLLISVICGTLTYFVLVLLNVPYAGLIAVFVAIADLIPLVGATLGAVVAALGGFSVSTTAGIVVVVFFVVYQQVENHLLQPVVFARTVRLNPLTVLIAILVGAELAGILGALLAIPVAGMIQVIVRDIWDERRGRPKREATAGADRRLVGSALAREERALAGGDRASGARSPEDGVRLPEDGVRSTDDGVRSTDDGVRAPAESAPPR